MRTNAATTLFKDGIAEINPGLRPQRRTHHMGSSGMVERRTILKAAAAFGGLSTLAVFAPAVSGSAQESGALAPSH